MDASDKAEGRRVNRLTKENINTEQIDGRRLNVALKADRLYGKSHPFLLYLYVIIPSYLTSSVI